MNMAGRFSPKRRVAVIGGGISGMAAAWHLAAEAEVVLFEAGARLGGHARTVMGGRNGDQPVDTGFIVFNYANYPNLVSLFAALDVPVVKSNMSWGASLAGGQIEYGLRSLGSIFAQKRNITHPRFLGMIRDIFRFNARALSLAGDPGMTIREFLERLGTGDWFRDYYLLPISGAIWSTPTERILDFPAQAMIRFFENHALLGATGQHQWYTVQGGSVEYVRRLEAALRQMEVDLRLSAPVQGVRRLPGGVELRGAGGDWEAFDEVVMATHADDTLAMLADPSPQETAALGAIRYQPNDAVLHGDTRLMPKSRAAWASWVYCEDHLKTSERIDLTYWMNSLQPIPESDPMFVTLNSTRAIREELIYDQVTFRHPVYDLGVLKAQEAIRGINGMRNTWFCGAWMRNGFHEDGYASALDVIEARGLAAVA